MKKIWVNGCFDILHRGHLEMLQYAKSLGQNLRVGIDSDTKVKKDKGKTRPYNNQEDRIFMLEGLSCIDEVVVFNTPEELDEMIKNYKPDALVVGSDWHGKTVVGADHANSVVYFDRIGAYSTTSILENR